MDHSDNSCGDIHFILMKRNVIDKTFIDFQNIDVKVLKPTQ